LCSPFPRQSRCGERGSWFRLPTGETASLAAPTAAWRSAEEAASPFKSARSSSTGGEFRLGAAGKFKTVDLKLEDGQTLLGVYELKGDEVTFCFSESGKPRPAGVAPKGSQWSERWKRESL